MVSKKIMKEAAYPVEGNWHGEEEWKLGELLDEIERRGEIGIPSRRVKLGKDREMSRKKSVGWMMPMWRDWLTRS